MAGKVSARCFIFYVLVHLSHVSLACILLLNGWAPLSVYERSSQTEIVATGEVLRTFKDILTEVGTYSAEVELRTIHKGADLVLEVQRASGQDGHVFNISNFGDKAMCYADVNAGDYYILFLTVFQNRLSAKYDDIFGAVADYTQENEQEVLDYLGEWMLMTLLVQARLLLWLLMVVLSLLLLRLCPICVLHLSFLLTSFCTRVH